jgi:adenosylhomocysteine nucleosidase
MNTSIRILVTFAVDWEFKPWLRLREFQPVAGDCRIFRTQIEGGEIRVLLTGVGPSNAAKSIRTVVDELPDLCIVSGLAGGLKHQYRPGEILVARSSRPESSSSVIESNDRLFALAVDCGGKPVERFVSAGRVIRTAGEKSMLAAFADAVDMESFAIMKGMSDLCVPCVAVRSVADSAEMNVPCDFDSALDESGRIRIVQVLGQVARDPRQAWPLAQLGLRSSRAAASLARFLDCFVSILVGHKEKMDLSVQHIG